MLPALPDGKLVLARKLSTTTTLKAGQVVIVNHPTYGKMVKRIESQTHNNQFTLSGDGVSSTSSVDLGMVNRNDILAVCLGVPAP